MTLEGIVATEFNSDEGLKAAFAQSIIDSSDGVFDDVVDMEATERRRLADGAASRSRTRASRASTARITPNKSRRNCWNGPWTL